MEQVNAEVLNVNITTGDVLALSTMTNEGEFIRLSLPGYHTSLDEGEPELPEIHNLIEIPQDATPRIELIVHEYKDYVLSDYDINSQIYPVQPSLSKSQNPEDIPFMINCPIIFLSFSIDSVFLFEFKSPFFAIVIIFSAYGLKFLALIKVVLTCSCLNNA